MCPPQSFSLPFAVDSISSMAAYERGCIMVYLFLINLSVRLHKSALIYIFSYSLHLLPSYIKSRRCTQSQR